MSLIDIYEGWREPNASTVTLTPTGLTMLAQLAPDDTVHLGLEITTDDLGTFVVTLHRTELLALAEILNHVLNATDNEVEALKHTLRHGPTDKEPDND
ncbi:hypothetical protein PUR22_21340 [Mycolicibacterium porcinum]|uniref:hypothetical protein n=1 Tax=Mycolicibacterium porcinum TaxID=39693 RepID=UPI0031FA33BA